MFEFSYKKIFTPTCLTPILKKSRTKTPFFPVIEFVHQTFFSLYSLIKVHQYIICNKNLSTSKCLNSVTSKIFFTPTCLTPFLKNHEQKNLFPGHRICSPNFFSLYSLINFRFIKSLKKIEHHNVSSGREKRANTTPIF